MCPEGSPVTSRSYERGRTSRLFRSFLQGWALDHNKSWLGIVLTMDLSEWFYSPKPFLQKGSQSSEWKTEEKTELRKKHFRVGNIIIWALVFTLKNLFGVVE